MSSGAVRLILTTCPEEAIETLATGLLERRLVACVNVVRGVVSRYWWKGKLVRDDEALLLLKTRTEDVKDVIAALRDLHPYDVPEALALPVEEGNPAYLDWVREVTERPGPEAPETPAT